MLLLQAYYVATLLSFTWVALMLTELFKFYVLNGCYSYATEK